jgi:hypothetical protein
LTETLRALIAGHSHSRNAVVSLARDTGNPSALKMDGMTKVIVPNALDSAPSE